MPARVFAWAVVLAVAFDSCQRPDAYFERAIDPRVVLRDIDASAPFPFIAPLTSAEGSVLFVGNSFTFVNDLPRVYGELVEGLGASPRVESFARGGWWLWMHLRAAEQPSSPLSHQLDGAWDVVTLQEQSTVSSFEPGLPITVSRLSALRLARRTSAPIVWYATWGHEWGDPDLPELSPDFVTMERRLEAGFRETVDGLSQAGHRVRIAPVGAAFARIHRALVTAGRDPTETGSAFDVLYDDDGYHPAPAGTYLAACVMFGTITGRDPAVLGDAPSLGLDAETERVLRLVARATLADPAWRP